MIVMEKGTALLRPLLMTWGCDGNDRNLSL